MEQPEMVYRSIHEDTPLERAVIPGAFRELATITESLCLSHPLEVPEPRELSSEARVVSQLGVHGLRMAIELTTGAELYTPSDPPMVGVADIIRTPDLFTHESYPEAVAWAEAFGAALLDEAYTTLGADVEAKMAGYRAATTPDQQLAVIDWLNERLTKMKETNDFAEELGEGDTEDYITYHPIRLAPKAIGVYPDITLPPTCLGFSIIAASFLRAAGASTMHAGVIRTDYEEATKDVIYQTELSAKEIETMTRGGTALSESLHQRNRDYRDDLGVDRGYHAVVLTRLADGSWCQIDPNFHATTRYEAGYMNEKIEQTFTTLNELADVAPALEIGVRMNGGTPLKGHIERWREVSSEELIPYRARIEEILTSDEDESVIQCLHECLVDAYTALYPIDGAEDFDDVDRYFRDSYLFEDTELGESSAYYSQQTFVADAVAHLLEKYVFYNRPVNETMERCRTDTAFLERRMEDVLAIIPALRTTSADTLAAILSETPIPHAELEVGRTETRIGFAVLSDVASYMPNDVPATFWHATWPSLIPVTERAGDAGGCGTLRGIYNMFAVVQARYLRYIKKYDTIYNAMPPIRERK